jgi:hypothetical protein
MKTLIALIATAAIASITAANAETHARQFNSTRNTKPGIIHGRTMVAPAILPNGRPFDQQVVRRIEADAQRASDESWNRRKAAHARRDLGASMDRLGRLLGAR